MDYQIKPVQVDGFADADGVYENRDGVWLGEWNPETESVDPYSDDGGDYIPAPPNWRDLIIKTV